jgi:hypothetical protein
MLIRRCDATLAACGRRIECSAASASGSFSRTPTGFTVDPSRAFRVAMQLRRNRASRWSARFTSDFGFHRCHRGAHCPTRNGRAAKNRCLHRSFLPHRRGRRLGRGPGCASRGASDLRRSARTCHTELRRGRRARSEQIVGITSPGDYGGQGYGIVYFIQITQTIMGGTSGFAGASGSGSGTVTGAGGAAVLSASGTIALP